MILVLIWVIIKEDLITYDLRLWINSLQYVEIKLLDMGSREFADFDHEQFMNQSA
jgi:hypothetical protein